MEEDLNELIKITEDRIAKVKEKIGDACAQAGRDPSEITLVGVSKVFPASHAIAAVKAGLKDLGENRVQELLPKYDTLKEEGLDPNWHLIGTLQKNKVKYIIGKTVLVHSVDSIELMAEINKRSAGSNIVTDLLLQANVSGEESKHGFEPDELKAALEASASMDNIRVRGMMTMAPIQQFEGQAQGVFAKTREIFDSLKPYVKDPQVWDRLSMGMSQDYEAAIREGSSIIRIGTAIFGDRRYIDAH